MVLYVAVIAIILYGTVPVLSAHPQYTWVYKHIGVVRYLEAHGTVDPNIDIYNRWPGFFALGAVFSTVAGRPNPETYVRWAELFFILLDIVLVMVAVKAIAGHIRIAAGAALFFLLTNWVGQTYYSPQAFTYVLGLGIIVVLLRQLQVPGTTYSQRLDRVIKRVGRVPQRALDNRQSVQWPRWAAIAVVVILDTVIVASHQLTPYMLLAGVMLLMLTGVLRPWWLLLLMAVVTLTYFAVNLTYIEKHFAVFSSIDPFRNAKVTPFTQTPAPGKVLNTHAELLAIVVLWLGGIWGSIRLFRRGLFIRALPLVVLAVSPLAVIFGQNYGGEASLRIILFSSPWLAALISWALITVTRRNLQKLLMMVGAVICAALFVPSFFGQAELNLVSASEIRASQWFYNHGRPGSVLMLSAPGFPLKYGTNYPEFRGPEGDAFPNLLRSHLFQNRQLGTAQIPDAIGQIRLYSPDGYLVFSKDETAFAEVMHLTPPGELKHLEAAVAHSPYFRLSYGNPDARIYELREQHHTLLPTPDDGAPE